MGSRGSGEFRGTDRFAVRRRVGSGGMGVVYEAYDLERDMRVAIKTILDADASTIYRFKKEFRSLTDVAHPNLVKIHELVLSDDHCFYTMEFVDGVDFLQFVCPTDPLSPDDPLSDTLDTYVALELTGLTGKTTSSGVATEPEVPLVGVGPPAVPDTVPASGTSGTTSESPGGGSGGDSRTSTENAMQTEPAGEPAANGAAGPGGGAEPGAARPDRPFHEVRLRAALRQLCEALQVLHTSGRLHRDIKPSNVLVARRARVVLLDFGLSTELEGREDHHSTTDGHIVGTAAYMAPEQAAGEPVSPASDWYSVGVMLYRALTGRLPFAGRSLDVMMKKRLSDPPPPKELDASVPDDLTPCASTCCVATRRTARRATRSSGGWAVRARPAASGPAGAVAAVRRPRAAARPARRGVRRRQPRPARRRVRPRPVGRRQEHAALAVPRGTAGTRRGGRPGRPVLRAGVGRLQGDRHADRLADAVPPAAAPARGRGPDAPRRHGAGARLPRAAAGRRRRRGAQPFGRRPRPAGAAPSRLRRAARDAGADRRPQAAWSWPSTTCNGATSTARPCSANCSSRPTRRSCFWSAPTAASTRPRARACGCSWTRRSPAWTPRAAARWPSAPWSTRRLTS